MTVGYDPTKPGLDEARLDAYRQLLVSKLDMLNLALTYDKKLPVGEVTAGMIEIGDSQAIWDVNNGPVRIRIRGGDDTGGHDMESALTMGVNGNAGFRYTFLTHLAIYLHPDALATLPMKKEADARERMLSRISDWVTLGVCNYWDPATESGGLVVNLNTNILTAAPGNDALLDSHVWWGYREFQFRGFGSAELMPALHLTIQASIE